MRRILLTGGGTGGHIYPLIAVVRELKKASLENNFPLDLHYLGPLDQYSKELIVEGVKLHSLATGKIRRYFSFQNIMDVPKFFWGVFQSFFKLLFIMPDVIFSKGGTGAFPVVFAGWFYFIPSLIHDSDAVPGLNTLLSSWFAKKIALSFESASKYFNSKKIILTGNPVREAILGAGDKPSAKTALGFPPDSPLIFVLGGSQGSKKVNEAILGILEELLKFTGVLHQAGPANFEEVKKFSQAVLSGISVGSELRRRYLPLDYLNQDQMKQAYAAADVAVSRAGSGSVFELAANGVPAILIPLGNADQHANAYAFAGVGAGTVIEEGNLTPQLLLNQIKAFLGSPKDLVAMSKAGKALFKPDAAERLAEEVLLLA
jgi:UDP-N-acetylglucosamine--N-acetylmuramyl-(pentapeptide) pyrophosphoryl-undecaprenol N-acetylglucosamine transferase